MSLLTPTRRKLLTASGIMGALSVAACDRLAASPDVLNLLDAGEKLSINAQRFLLSDQPLAREFADKDRSPIFKVNGSSSVRDPKYNDMAARAFIDYRLEIGGMVNRPLSLSLAQIKTMPSRTQTTRHDCVEGWSAIGKWQGVQLGRLLSLAGVQPGARFILFRCADDLEPSLDGSGRYYETIDLFDAFHAQTILAYNLNDEALSIGHGAPLRLRVERQLGYKQAKFVMGIEAIDSFAKLGGGKGGYWEDRGYQWYGGI